MDLLEQVGITKDELIDRIVDKALGITADHRQTGEETWEDIPLSSVVDAKITSAIGSLVDKMKPMIEGRINEIMNAEIEKVFTSPFQPVTRWGEPKGEMTTIRDIIAKEATDYWSKKVDSSNGKEYTGFGNGEERAVYYARKVMSEFYEKELVKTVKKMAEDLKSKIPETIAKEISETVIKHLR